MNDRHPTSTLLDYGHNLPIGIPEGNPVQLAKSFAFKPYRTKDEQAIEKARKGKQHPGRDAVTVLVQMLTEWGGDPDFSSKPEKNRRASISRAYMADVLYAYIALRVEALGPYFALKTECSSCGHEHEWKTDLRGVQITIAEGADDLAQPFKLKHPIEHGETLYDELVCGPPTWSAVSGLDAGTRRSGVTDIKLAMVRSSIREMRSSANPKKPSIQVGPLVLGEMSKMDLERLTRAIDDLFPSTDITFEIECPSCGVSTPYGLAWAFPFFFGGSSLPTET